MPFDLERLPYTRLARTEAIRKALDLAASGIDHNFALALPISDIGRKLAEPQRSGSVGDIGRKLAEALGDGGAGWELSEAIAASDIGWELVTNLAISDTGWDVTTNHVAVGQTTRSLIRRVGAVRPVAASGIGRRLTINLAASDTGQALAIAAKVTSDTGCRLAENLVTAGIDWELTINLSASGTNWDVILLVAASDTGQALAEAMATSDTGRELATILTASGIGRQLCKNLHASGVNWDQAANLAASATVRKLANIVLSNSGTDQNLIRTVAATDAGRKLANALAAKNIDMDAGVAMLVLLLPMLGLWLFATAGLAAAEVLFVAGAATWVDDGDDVDREMAKPQLTELEQPNREVASSRTFARHVLAEFPDTSSFASQYSQIVDVANRAFPEPTEFYIGLAIDRHKFFHNLPELDLMMAIVARLMPDGTVELVDYETVAIPNKHDERSTASSVAEVVGPLAFVDQLDSQAAGVLRSAIEPLLGHVEAMYQEGVFADDPVIEERVTSLQSLIPNMMLGDEAGTVDTGAVLFLTQTLMATVVPYFPADEPGAELGTALAHDAEATPEPATAVADVDAIASAVDRDKIGIGDTISIPQWLTERLGWAPATTVAAGAAVVAFGNTTDVVGGILQGLGITGPWSMIVGAAIGLLTTAWIPERFLRRPDLP